MLDKARKVQTFFIKGLLQSVDEFSAEYLLAGALPGARRMWQSHVSSVCGRAPSLPMGRHNGYEDETRDSGSKYAGSRRIRSRLQDVWDWRPPPKASPPRSGTTGCRVQRGFAGSL